MEEKCTAEKALMRLARRPKTSLHIELYLLFPSAYHVSEIILKILGKSAQKSGLPIGIVAKGVKTPLPAVREGGETLGVYTIPKEDRQASI